MLYVQSDSQPYQMSEYSEKLKKRTQTLPKKQMLREPAKQNIKKMFYI